MVLYCEIMVEGIEDTARGEDRKVGLYVLVGLNSDVFLKFKDLTLMGNLLEWKYN